MIRVLHAVGKMHRAGQETITMNLYRALDRSCVQFDFLVHTDEKCDYDDEIAELGGRLFHVQKINCGVIRYVRSIRKIVRDNGYTIVHLHTAHAAGFFVLLAAKLGGARVRIAHSRNNNAELPWLHKLLRPFIRRYSTDRFACSEAAGRWMFGDHCDFTVKRNAIDTNAFRFSEGTRESLRAALGLEGRLTIGHVGRFVEQKNHAFLLQICAAIAKRQPDFRALLIGAGELEPKMKALADELGIAENLLFLGPRGDVPQLMQAMDVFVFPSLYEGFGNVMIEAQAAGLPCVAADTLTRETNVSGNVAYLPLTESAGRWADVILAAKPGKREQGASIVADAGYDVYREATGFMEFYEAAAKRG